MKLFYALLFIIAVITVKILYVFAKFVYLSNEYDKSVKLKKQYAGDYTYMTGHKSLMDRLYCTKTNTRITKNTYYVYKHSEARNKLIKLERHHPWLIELFITHLDRDDVIRSDISRETIENMLNKAKDLFGEEVVDSLKVEEE